MTNKETLKELIDQLFGADYANVERFLKSLVNLNSKRTLHGLSGNLILYDADLEAWAQEQARASRAMDWAALDVEHLAEEVESLGNEQEYAVTSHLRILLLYLLKWRYQPDKRSESWTSSIGNARDEIEDRLVRNPGICPRLDVFLATIYPRARRRAQRETSLPLATFSETRLWGISQIINEDFWPAPPMCNRRLPAHESHRLADAEFDLMMTSEKKIYWANRVDGRCHPMHKKKGAEVYR